MRILHSKQEMWERETCCISIVILCHLIEIANLLLSLEATLSTLLAIVESAFMPAASCMYTASQ